MVVVVTETRASQFYERLVQYLTRVGEGIICVEPVRVPLPTNKNCRRERQSR